MTPLLRLHRAGAQVGISRLYMKDEGLLPTGTFKARGAAVGVSRARELGVDALAMPTNGNAGAAWAAYSAAAGIECVIVMPTDAPLIHRKECAVTGATFYLVDGLISDAGRQVAGGVKRHGWYDASTLKEPYRIEGKKTMGLELAEQFRWQLPDVIIYPHRGRRGAHRHSQSLPGTPGAGMAGSAFSPNGGRPIQRLRSHCPRLGVRPPGIGVLDRCQDRRFRDHGPEGLGVTFWFWTLCMTQGAAPSRPRTRRSFRHNGCWPAARELSSVRRGRPLWPRRGN